MKLLTIAALSFVLMTSHSFADDRASLTAWGGLGLPTGYLGDLYDSGIGFEGNFEYLVTPSLGITASAGYYSWSDSQELEEFFDESFDISLSTIPLLAGVRYYVIPWSTSPYLSAEVGLHIVSWDESFMGETASDSGSDIGFGVGGGLLLFLNPDFQLDAHVKYNSINTERDSLDFISLLIGVRIVL